ncbi:MAG TPA: BON domain-containing protein [Woeseiaceae bacterium]|nr:BON domain-containing protein [Woeseiaceae bacterium]
MARNRWQGQSRGSRDRWNRDQERQFRDSDDEHRSSYSRSAGYGRSHPAESDWGYPRSHRGDYERGDDESYFRGGRPERGGRGYIGGDPTQGYVGFGPEQGFWRSSNPYGREHGYERDYGRHQGRDYEEERGWWDRTSDEVASWMGDEEAEQRRRMDEMRSHRGRGPRGYTRSDERIRDDVNDWLTDDWALDASEIEVQVSNGEVTLSGTVSNRHDKRRAEDIAEEVSGVRHVQNNLRVREAMTSIGGTEASGATTASPRARK